jgi:hypothetical protein
MGFSLLVSLGGLKLGFGFLVNRFPDLSRPFRFSPGFHFPHFDPRNPEK